MRNLITPDRRDAQGEQERHGPRGRGAVGIEEVPAVVQLAPDRRQAGFHARSHVADRRPARADRVEDRALERVAVGRRRRRWRSAAGCRARVTSIRPRSTSRAIAALVASIGPPFR